MIYIKTVLVVLFQYIKCEKGFLKCDSLVLFDRSKLRCGTYCSSYIRGKFEMFHLIFFRLSINFSHELPSPVSCYASTRCVISTLSNYCLCKHEPQCWSAFKFHSGKPTSGIHLIRFRHEMFAQQPVLVKRPKPKESVVSPCVQKLPRGHVASWHRGIMGSNGISAAMTCYRRLSFSTPGFKDMNWVQKRKPQIFVHQLVNTQIAYFIFSGFYVQQGCHREEILSLINLQINKYLH